jgi:hypothetical protein
MDRRFIKIAAISAIFFFGLSVNMVSASVSPKVKAVSEELKAWGQMPEIVEAVKKQNAKGMSLDSIKALDKKWMATAGVADFMKEYSENPTASYLKGLEKQKPYYTEIFVMDNQGAIVAETSKTSDFWQGDEAKFKVPFNNGSGGTVEISKEKFDDSAQAYLVQVSVPVVDPGTGKAIGAITIGINVDKL